MPTLDDKISFAQSYIQNKEGIRFSLKGRQWVKDDFFLPVDGFKLWNTKANKLCKECKPRIGEIIEHPDDNPTIGCYCKGLEAEPIIVTILNLHRQDGKTFSVMAYGLSTIFKNKNKSLALLAASEDQGEVLYRENYRQTVEKEPKLAKRAVIKRMRLDVPKQNSSIEVLSASHKSATGRSRTHLLLDEARDIEARVAMALLPAIFTMHGIECPYGHIQLNAEQAIDAPEKCSMCGERLTPWYGRIVIATASGVIDDNESDWCYELIEHLTKEPHPNFHVFQSDVSLNPAKSEKIVHAVEDVFGRLHSTRDYVSAEVGAQWTRKGNAFMNKADLSRCYDKNLTNDPTGFTAPCFGFLDTSLTTEKTALVIVADDIGRSSFPFEYVYQAWLYYWIPKNMPNGVIDDRAVRQHLDLLMPMIPGLKKIYVDTRGMPWAISMTKEIKKSNVAWKHKIQDWYQRYEESDKGWSALQHRILNSPEPTIRLQYDKAQEDEFKGLKLKNRGQDGQLRVVDINRNKQHKDITESLAMCCYYIAVDMLSKKLSISQTVKRIDKKRITGLRAGRGRPITGGLHPNKL